MAGREVGRQAEVLSWGASGCKPHDAPPFHDGDTMPETITYDLGARGHHTCDSGARGHGGTGARGHHRPPRTTAFASALCARCTHLHRHLVCVVRSRVEGQAEGVGVFMPAPAEERGGPRSLQRAGPGGGGGGGGGEEGGEGVTCQDRLAP